MVRAEQVAAECRVWVALARDLVGLVFQLLVLAAFAWCLWTYLDLVSAGRAALETEHGARDAGRTLDAFLSALSAPALGALGVTGGALLLTVVLVLRGDGGFFQGASGAGAPSGGTQGAQWGIPPWFVL